MTPRMVLLSLTLAPAAAALLAWGDPVGGQEYVMRSPPPVVSDSQVPLGPFAAPGGGCTGGTAGAYSNGYGNGYAAPGVSGYANGNGYASGYVNGNGYAQGGSYAYGADTQEVNGGARIQIDQFGRPRLFLRRRLPSINAEVYFDDGRRYYGGGGFPTPYGYGAPYQFAQPFPGGYGGFPTYGGRRLVPGPCPGGWCYAP